MKRVIKPILGVGLLGLVLSQLDALRLFELLRYSVAMVFGGPLVLYAKRRYVGTTLGEDRR